MKMRRIALSLVLSSAAAGFAGAQTQAGSPVTEYLTKGKNALNDLRYKEADSLARRVLALGSLLSKTQQIEAMQLSIAALYPEEAAERQQDSAIAMIKQIVDAGAKGIPKDMSWPGLDSLFAFVARAAQPGRIVLGSRINGAVLYVNGDPQGVIYGLRVVLVPPNKPTKLSINAPGCVAWDSTVVVQAADSVRIGNRNPRCTP